MNAPLRDVGFFDPRGARVVLRRRRLAIVLKRASVSIEALLDGLDQMIDADRNAASACRQRAIALEPGAFERVERDGSFEAIDSKDVREKELLEGLDLVLELFDAVGVGLGHGLFSNDVKPASAATGRTSQSLCQCAEKTPPAADAGDGA